MRHSKTKRRQSRHRKHSRTISRSLKGGSAWQYSQSVAGSPEQQYNNTFSQSGPYGQIQGNVLPQLANYAGIPNQQQLSLAQSAGRKRYGGNLGTILYDAAVPATLLTLQQKYKKKHSSKKRSVKK